MALITVLFTVALIATLAVAISHRLALDIRRTEYNRNQGQMLHLLFGIEAWAVGRIRQDSKNDAGRVQIDHENEVWNDKIAFEIVDNQANVSAKISDMQSRFNINNLLVSSGDNKGTQPPGAEAHYRFLLLLLERLNLDKRLADAIVDWIDSDSQTRFPGGAEDEDYAAKTLPHRTPNRKITSVRELAQIKHITPESLQKLTPFITALPVETKINVNTAPREVLAALSTHIDSSIIDAIIDLRKKTPFRSNNEFIEFVKKTSGKPDLDVTAMTTLIGVSSNYFQCDAQVVLRQAQLRSMSIVERDPNHARVYLRTRNP